MQWCCFDVLAGGGGGVHDLRELLLLLFFVSASLCGLRAMFDWLCGDM